MADIEITDKASLKAWLKPRPREDAKIIAFRAAARVFPPWGSAIEEEWVLWSSHIPNKPNFTAIDCLRVLQTAFAMPAQSNSAMVISRNPAADFFEDVLLSVQPRSVLESAYRFSEYV